MPGPFSGVDPFLESQVWEDFHHGLISLLQERLLPLVRPRYVVRVERRVYVERPGFDESDEPTRVAAIGPDVWVSRRTSEAPGAPPGPAAVAAEPTRIHLPVPETRHEAFLTIRDREGGDVVTIIEVLSPANKRRGREGRREYLRKRETVLQSETHLVELDLLRGGERLPAVEPLPPADYYAFVCRAGQRPEAELYAWSLRQPAPALPIPLGGEDADIVIDLSRALGEVYDRKGYDYSLDYDRAISPPLTDEDARWARQAVERFRAGRSGDTGV